jgi:hypothetical protein
VAILICRRSLCLVGRCGTLQVVGIDTFERHDFFDGDEES